MGDIIPGKGRNRHTNFIMHLARFEPLKTKSKDQMNREKNDVDNKGFPSVNLDEVSALE